MTRLEPHSPGAIFLQLISKIEARLRRAKRARSFKDLSLANELRGDLFKLEGWAKLHRTWPVKKERATFEKIRFWAKELEDALGAMDVAHEIAEDLRGRKASEIAALFDEQIETAYKKAKKILKKWLPREDKASRAEKIRLKLVRVSWPSMTAQMDFVLQALFHELTGFSNRYREELKPKLIRDIYDRDVLEFDLHKMRRQLRWFSMYFQTADGLIGLAPVGSKLTKEKQKLVEEYRDNPFAILPARKYARAHVDPIAFYELTRLIDLLGHVKDNAERYFHVRDLLKARGDKNAVDIVETLYGDVPHDTPHSAHTVMAEYERMKPHAYLAESLFE